MILTPRTSFLIPDRQGRESHRALWRTRKTGGSSDRASFVYPDSLQIGTTLHSTRLQA